MTELCADPSCMTPLKSLLSQLPDLERGLCTVYHRKVGLSMLNCISSNNNKKNNMNLTHQEHVQKTDFRNFQA